MEGILYSQICKVEHLLSAWGEIKNKGSAGGIDDVSIEMFEKDLEKNLRDLSDLLTTNRYIPEPYKEIKIPKDEAEFRYKKRKVMVWLVLGWPLTTVVCRQLGPSGY